MLRLVKFKIRRFLKRAKKISVFSLYEFFSRQLFRIIKLTKFYPISLKDSNLPSRLIFKKIVIPENVNLELLIYEHDCKYLNICNNALLTYNPIFDYKLNNCIVYTDGRILCNNFYYIKDYGKSYGLDYQSFNFIDYSKISINSVEYAISGFAFNGSNYFHFIFDSLFSYIFLLTTYNYPILIDEKQQWQIDLIQIFFNKEIKSISVENNIHVHNLFITDTVDFSGRPNPYLVHFLRNKYLNNFPSCSISQDKIYISRSKASSRKIINENTLLPYLIKLGFKIVHLEDLNVLDQIKIFSNAFVILGPHGAGFSNILFSNPKVRIIEIFDFSYTNGCFQHICNLLNYKYDNYIVHQEKIGNYNRQYHLDYKIPINEFLNWLNNKLYDNI